MKISNIPPSIPMQQAKYVRENGSDAANVRVLMNQMDRETLIMEHMESAVNDAEDFPNRIHESSTSRLRRLLDII